MAINSITLRVLQFALIWSLLTLCGLCEEGKHGGARLWKSRVETYVGRLHPNQDIMSSLVEMLSHQKHNAVTIASATGSVLHCYIRFANQSYLTKVDGPLEITSLTGTFDHRLQSHVHIAVADGSGKAFGGHLPSLAERKSALQTLQSNYKIEQDCPIFTTLQVSLLHHKDVRFARKTDPQTTFDELYIEPNFFNLEIQSN